MSMLWCDTRQHGGCNLPTCSNPESLLRLFRDLPPVAKIKRENVPLTYTDMTRTTVNPGLSESAALQDHACVQIQSGIHINSQVLEYYTPSGAAS